MSGKFFGLRGAGANDLAKSSVGYDFLISQISQEAEWCLTAVEGTKDFGNLGLRPCDMDGVPDNQQWKLDSDGKLRSKLDDTMCMIVGYGHSESMFDGVRMRLADCDATLFNTFEWEEDYLHPTDDTTMCVTNRGPIPHTSDSIHAKPCMDRGDHKWLHESNRDDADDVDDGTVDLCAGVVCPEPGSSCDPIDGSCKTNNDLRPCIAVIDEADNDSNAAFDAKWAAFRAEYPDRFVCLLQPQIPNTGFDALHLPAGFAADPRTKFAQVNRDEGDEALASDWFNICGLYSLVSTGIDYVGLFVDESGSMYVSTVQASYDKFLEDLTEANLTYRTLMNPDEDWIEPFMTVLN